MDQNQLHARRVVSDPQIRHSRTAACHARVACHTCEGDETAARLFAGKGALNGIPRKKSRRLTVAYSIASSLMVSAGTPHICSAIEESFQRRL